MSELNLNQIRRRLYAEGCADLLRRHGMSPLVTSSRQNLRGGHTAVEEKRTLSVRPA